MATKHEESQQPKNTPLSQTRRSALKKMLVGTSVAAGATALPGKWAKPIVDKVLVPAHAQTSPQCDPLTISGDTITCLDDVGRIAEAFFWVDDSGDCPVISTDSDEPDDTTVFVKHLERFPSFLRAVFDAAWANPVDPPDSHEIDQSCQAPGGGSVTDLNYRMRSSSGNLYRLTGSIIVSGPSDPSIEISTLTIVPI